MTKVFIAIIIGILFGFGCGSNPAGSNKPEITFTGLSKDTLFQSSLNTDSTTIFIRFADADGDLGGNDNKNLIIIDTRTGEEYDSFSLPSLPKPSDGLEGEIAIRLFTTCCIFPNNIPPCEAPPEFPTNELILNIIMKDDAGNSSNPVSTSPITLICN